MSKYIEISTLKEYIENWFVKHRYYHPYSRSNNIPIDELYDLLDIAPSSYAYWKTDVHKVFGEDITRFICSVCQKPSPDAYDYCPNCGADMRGEQDE